VYISKLHAVLRLFSSQEVNPGLDSTQHSSSRLHELVCIDLMTVISSVQYGQVDTLPYLE